MSRPGILLAGLYIAGAAFFLVQDAMRPPTGGWINLRHLLPAVLTFPLYAPLELLGLAPDLANKGVVATLVGGCATLIYFLAAGSVRAAKWFFPN